MKIITIYEKKILKSFLLLLLGLTITIPSFSQYYSWDIGSSINKSNGYYSGQIEPCEPILNYGLIGTFKLGISWKLLMGEVVEDYSFIWEQDQSKLRCEYELKKYPDLQKKLENIAPVEIWFTA